MNKSAKGGNPCLVSKLRGKTLSFTIKYDVKFFLDVLYQIEENPFYSYFSDILKSRISVKFVT